MRYSLADYIVSITPPTAAQGIFSPIEIGGNGKYVGSINVSYSNNMYDVESYSTGAYVFNKNLSRTGTVSISLNQLCEEVALLKRMTSVLFDNDFDGFTIAIRQRDNATVASCVDCYPSKIPDQAMENTAQMQSWQFVAGKITM